MSSIIQRSFSAGEITEALNSRVDTTKYATGARTVRNMIVMRHGGLQNRPGTIYIGRTYEDPVTSDQYVTRLIPFVFNNDQTYVLELGNDVLRFIRNGAYIDVTKNITNITIANPGVITVTAHGLETDDRIYIDGIVGTVGTELNGINWFVKEVVDANSFKISLFRGGTAKSTSGKTYTSGGTFYRIYKRNTGIGVDSDSPERVHYAQSADVMNVVNGRQNPRQIRRLGHSEWEIIETPFEPSISTPSGLAVSGASGTTDQWVITAIAEVTYEESLPTSAVGANSTASSGSPRTLSWSALSGAQEYNIYKYKNGIYGYIGTTDLTTFVDDGIVADITDTPPKNREIFAPTSDFPNTVTYAQQRLFFGGSTTKPETIWGSRISQYQNFAISSPIQDDDSVTFTLVGKQVNEIRGLIEAGSLIALTSGGETQIQGDASGIIRPGEVNPRQYSARGSSYVQPISANGTILFIQGRESKVIALGFDYQVDGYRGSELSLFSAHLVDGYRIIDWAYQQNPHSIVWMVRDDGILLGLTFVEDQQIFAWHRHDFDGLVEAVCCVPEGSEDALYLVINRDGIRCVERMANRNERDVVDGIFMDATISYDGRNTDDTHTMTLSGGTTWNNFETLTLTSSDSFFTAGDVGNQIHLKTDDGDIVRFSIVTYSSSTVVTGKPHKIVPVALRSATSNWAKAVDELSGLDHLEGKQVAILADGFVVASPNNDSVTPYTVTGGALTLERPYSVIHVGLPYLSDLETLDIDTTDGETIADKKCLVTGVSAHVQSTRGLWAGSKAPSDDDDDPLAGLTELKVRDEESMDQPVELITKVVDININGQWTSNGRVFLRQVDPLPLSILSVIPQGKFPFRGGG